MRVVPLFFTLLLAGCGAPVAENDSVAIPSNNSSIARNANSTTDVSPTTPPSNRTVTGDPTPAFSPLPPDADGVRSAIDVVHKYYDAINERDFRIAYELWSGNGEASNQTFEKFRDGFSNTAWVEIDTSGEPGDMQGAAGSQYVAIPLLINAKTKGGQVQNYWGQYVLRRSMVDGATAEQRLWRIYSAEIRELPDND